jgi:ABC-type sugar transport system substrate-binding protein
MHSHSRTRIAGPLSVAVGVAVVISACSSSGTSTSAASTAPSTASTSAAAAPSAPVTSAPATSASGSVVASASSGGSAATSSAPAAGAVSGKKIALVLKPLDNVYFGAMEQGAAAEAKKLGVSLTTVAAANVTDDSGQAAKLQALVSSGYDCYIVNPTSPTNLLRPLATVSKANTPIVNIDLPISTSAAQAAGVKVLTYIGTVNATAGQAGGQEMLKLLPNGGKVALVGGLADDPGSLARLKGFSDTVAGKLTITQTVASDAVRAKAQSEAATIIRANPDIKGFFTVGGDMAMGIQTAVVQAGDKGKIAVVGIDGTKEQLTDIIGGGEPAAIEQFPYLMGSQAVEACMASIAGKSVPPTLDTPVFVVTKATAAQALASYPAPPASFTYTDPLATLVGN